MDKVQEQLVEDTIDKIRKSTPEEQKAIADLVDLLWRSKEDRDVEGED